MLRDERDGRGMIRRMKHDMYRKVVLIEHPVGSSERWRYYARFDVVVSHVDARTGRRRWPLVTTNRKLQAASQNIATSIARDSNSSDVVGNSARSDSILSRSIRWT